MPRKKTVKKTVAVKKENEPYSKGDFCYCLGYNNKVFLAEVQEVKSIEGNLCYTVIDQASQKYYFIEHAWCHDNEKILKKKKRQ